MTSGTTSPTPNDSPTLSHRPLLITRELELKTKKTVEFQAVYKTDDDKSNEGWYQDHYRSVVDDKNQKVLGARLLQPRMSLHGKPVTDRPPRRDARYRKRQSRIYNFLERPSGPDCYYHIVVFFMVFAGLVLSVFSTINEYEEKVGNILVYTESIVCLIFGLELMLRIWSSGCRSRYQGFIGRLKFIKRPFCIIDIITIVASVVVFAITMRSGGQVITASALRGLRFFQILRMVRMDRRGGTWKLLGSVVYSHRQELVTTLYIGFLGLIFSSFLVFLAEKDVPNTKFTNFAQALWWGVITLCTVGYGDMVPFTWQGKIIASFCSLLGISFFALPAGILGSGFALKVQQQQRQKHIVRRRQPAAILIQSVWRCYASDEHSTSDATWKIYQVPYSPPSRLTSSFRQNASFVGRFSTIRRHRSQASATSLQPPSLIQSRNLPRINSFNDSVGNSSNGLRSNLNASFNGESIETKVTVDNSGDDDEEPQLIELTPEDKAAIRVIRMLKYLVARKKFREALKPYDVHDIIDQYSTGHADMLSRVKNLQYRLDQILGKQGSRSKDVYASKISLASRVVNVERQVDDVVIKIQQFFELYMEDRKHLLSEEACQRGLQIAQLDVYNMNSPVSMPSTSFQGSTSRNSSHFKPKSILVSQPNSPVNEEVSSLNRFPTVSKKPSKYLDPGNKTKKRVTLSSTCCNYIEPKSAASPVKDSFTIIVPQTTSAPSTSIPPSASAQSLSINLELNNSETTTPRSENSFDYEEVEEGEDGEEGEREEKLDDQEFDDQDDNEDEANETTLLCPTTQNEIIITPSTLNCTSKVEIGTEDIYMTNFNPLN